MVSDVDRGKGGRLGDSVFYRMLWYPSMEGGKGIQGGDNGFRLGGKEEGIIVQLGRGSLSKYLLVKLISDRTDGSGHNPSTVLGCSRIGEDDTCHLRRETR